MRSWWRCPAVGAIVLCAAISQAQDFPTRPVRVLTAETGGGSDIISRLVAAPLTTQLGQQVVIENRVGGLILSELAARATPDGHTLLLYSNALWLLPLMRTVQYDVGRDFTPVSLLVSAPSVLVVHPSLAAKTVGDLIDAARAKPGDLNYASGPLGATPHLAGELFKAMARLDIVHVPYKGVGLALNDVIAGRVQMMFPTQGAASQHVRAGRLRALAVTGAKPSSVFPGLPTIASAGLPDYEVTTIFGLFVPAKTPRALVARLAREASAAVRSPLASERLGAIGYDLVASTPEELAVAVRADVGRLGKVIRERGIRAE